MRRQRWILLPSIFLLACVAILPACKKKSKPTEESGNNSTSGSSTSTNDIPPPANSGEYVLLAHLKVKEIRESTLFTEIKQAFAKAGGTAEWDELEGKVAQELGGVKPTDIELVTICVMEVPAKAEPKLVVILATNKAIEKARVFGLGAQARPDARGFYNTPRGFPGLIHFPDDKTLVLVHPDLAQKYLDGYAKDRTGWPMGADLTRASTGHTLYASLNATKIPQELRNIPEAQEFSPLLAARKMTLTADLKGKELSVAARASYASAAAANKAKESATKAVALGTGLIESVMGGNAPADLVAVMPAVKEAHRTLKEAKIEVSGSDLVVNGSYKADFDIGTIVVEAVKKVREASTRMASQNNLKQIGLALFIYGDANARVPILGVGVNGTLLKTAAEKPLLSWRVALLPYLEQGNLYREFRLNEPWDSAHNKKLIEKMPKVYAPVAKTGKPGYTHMQMVVGPNAMQPPTVVIPGSFPDGTSNTIAVVEAAEPVIWTKPDDVMLPGPTLPKDLKKKFGGLSPEGFNVVLWDGSVRFVSNSIDERTLGLLLNPRDGQPIPNW